jgi:hypothetical protein
MMRVLSNAANSITKILLACNGVGDLEKSGSKPKFGVGVGAEVGMKVGVGDGVDDKVGVRVAEKFQSKNRSDLSLFYHFSVTNISFHTHKYFRYQYKKLDLSE